VAIIMLVAVTERTREIGIRKAIGAPRRAILKQFLIGAVVLTGLGGLLGVFVGVAITVSRGLILPSSWSPSRRRLGFHGQLNTVLV
jgi:putative ABC transport system permease protein